MYCQLAAIRMIALCSQPALLDSFAQAAILLVALKRQEHCDGLQLACHTLHCLALAQDQQG
jgi:hypothetical protein